MTTTTRFNNLILNQDWKRIYQTFKQADFTSYDFENIRRVIINYIRENYPEDFNDYIESSEYMALIDAIAFIGQSLSFRIDLASRENFIELAERKESVLRLARMLSYNANRNVSAGGLLKFVSVSTTEDLIDSNGRNLAQRIILWNDATNRDWNDQFITVINSALADNIQFGRSEGTAVLQGIITDQYRFRTSSTDVPIFTFAKTVAGRRMDFEIVSTSFKDSESIYEQAPVPGTQLGFVYRQDNKGPGSANTGFFLLFKQGSLELADFAIDVPTSNERVRLSTDNINNDDLWLFGLDSNGTQSVEWKKVSSLIGNNVAYNSLAKGERNFFALQTQENDQVDLIFADGVYGNLPQGSFRCYYRVGNGLSYSINPTEMKGINVSFTYLNKKGEQHTLTVGLDLTLAVTNAEETENIDSIRVNAPATYYTQNRMVTAEDYNLAPLSSSQSILKVKSVNRTSSGVSRNFEIVDASGKYSSTNIFAGDGYIYKQESEKNLSFTFSNSVEIINFIKNQVEKELTATATYNFYFTKFNKINFTDDNTVWTSVSADINRSTGYFRNIIAGSLLKTGNFSTSALKYVFTGALIKFVAPAGKAFRKNVLVDIDPNDPEQRSYRWTKVIQVVGDGTNNGQGALPNGLGPVTFNDIVPAGAIAKRIVPRFVTDLSQELETEIVNQMTQSLNFALRYDLVDFNWKIISAANVDYNSPFSLGKTGDTTNNNLDASWMISFVKQPVEYVIRIRGLEYLFGSVKENRFYFDSGSKSYDVRTGKVSKDLVTVLGVNTDKNLINPLVKNIPFEINESVSFDDGYKSSIEVKISFSDADDDGVIDDPESFEQIVGEDQDLSFIFFREIIDQTGTKIFNYFDNSSDTILIRQRESQINVNNFVDGQLIYFYDSAENRVKRVDLTTETLILDTTYKGVVGRDRLKFQYFHNASIQRRIDPSVSNIIDVYLLVRSYDTAFRIWLSGGSDIKPLPPSTEDLRISFGSRLAEIKTLSDEVIYHPVKYKVLFGNKADANLQVKFKVVKNPDLNINDNDLKVRIIDNINGFFDVQNWDFGDKFYASELISYVTYKVAPDVSNMVLLPLQSNQPFGSLYEIQSNEDEILVNGATVDNIEIISSISTSELRVEPSEVADITDDNRI